MPTAPPPYQDASRAGQLPGRSFCPDVWKEVRRELQLACPVFVDPQGQRYHEPLDFKTIKSLAESVRTYGITASFTIAQVEALHRHCMTPNDWAQLAKACLSPGQYLDWKAFNIEFANEQAAANVAAGGGQAAWDRDMLLGQGRFTQQQNGYPPQVYEQINNVATRAWKSLPNKGEVSGNLTKILQGPMEPFSDFIARLVEAAGRIFGDADAAMPLIKQLAYEQCTKECRAAITPYKGKGLEVWMKIDIKDCFFSIPLCPQDSVRFAFTVPSCNHEEPDQRYEWIVLPQGMANSPTMCQLYVGNALTPLRKRFPALRCLHYMDDVLLTSKSEQVLDQAYEELVKCLERKKLYIAPEKVQKEKIINYLGAKIDKYKVFPQKIELRKDHLCTLNDFQKLLGDINWIRSYLRMPNYELKPLYNILVGDSALDSPQQLTAEAREALCKVEERLKNAFLCRWKEDQDIVLCILPTYSQPTGLLWQDGPLLWIYSKISPAKSIEHYPTAVANLAQLGIQQCIQFFGMSPTLIVVPYTSQQVKILCGTIDEWAILQCGFDGQIDNHYPKHPLLSFFKEHPVVFSKVTSSYPIKGAPNIFTDGSKTGCGAYMIEHSDPVLCQFQPKSPQIVELQIVVEVFKKCPFAFNLISDSAYVVNAVKILELAGPIKVTSTVHALLQELQDLIWHRGECFYIQHIRAHSGLPGPLSEGNDIVDRWTRMECIFMNSSLDQAKQFHQQFHVSSKTLQQKFHLSRADARQIVLNCPHCVVHLHPPGIGVNPRGLLPLKTWQMDVTHIPDFGNLKYVHVSVDTCSGVIHATPLSGEKARNVIGHCLEAWAAWGKPQHIKTDNGPAYTAQSFVTFCKQMEVSVNHGLPYNPQGQGIIERTHRTLKECLLKQKGGIGHGRTAKERISLALFTLNFLNLDNDGRSAADRHFSPERGLKGFIKWKDILTGKWHGPDPVLCWARGSVCVFPQDRQEPLWVPERLTRRCDRDEHLVDLGTSQPGMDTGASGATMGDPVGVPKTNANTT